jgi:uncharacterized protein (DUF2062 family)
LKAAALRFGASVEGLSAESMAILLAAGLVLGTFPVYGCPTLLCLLAALVFRWNAPALQLVNQLASPVQLALLVPFARIGERILRPPAQASHSALSRPSALTMQVLAGWLCLALPLGLLVYFAVSLALRRCRPAVLNQ